MRDAKTYYFLPHGDRIRANTRAAVNELIDLKVVDNIHFYLNRRPDKLDERIDELSAESDVEQIIFHGTARLIIASAALGLVLNRRFWLVALALSGMLVQLSWQGWCLPLPLLRRAGWRSRQEIDAEKNALLAAQQEQEHEAAREVQNCREFREPHHMRYQRPA